MDELMRFESHIEGKNAEVVIFPDRIEWSRQRRLRRSGDSELIPMRSVSSVTSKREGLRFTRVSVICSGNTIDFRVGHSEAQAIRSLISDLLLGKHPSQQT